MDISGDTIACVDNLVPGVCMCGCYYVCYCTAHAVYKTLFLADILHCRSRKSTDETYFDKDGLVPLGVPVGQASEPAYTMPGP